MLHCVHVGFFCGSGLFGGWFFGVSGLFGGWLVGFPVVGWLCCLPVARLL